MISRKQSKFIKSLKIKKFRERENAFIVEGAKNVNELLNSNYQTLLIVGTEEYFLEHNQKVDGIEIAQCSAKDLSDLGTFKSNNECLAVAVREELGEMDLRSNDFLIALDEVSDPGNLGTIIRTLDWFGFSKVICSKGTADFYNPKVVNATMGSFTRVKPVYTDLIPFIRKHDIPAYGADISGVSISDWLPEKPSIIVMGSESHGISLTVRQELNNFVHIPGLGRAESLNVGIATGIFCHHLRSRLAT